MLSQSLPPTPTKITSSRLLLLLIFMSALTTSPALAFRLPTPDITPPAPSTSKTAFTTDGFTTLPTPFLSPSFVATLHHSLERLIRHDYDAGPSKRGGGAPDKPTKKINVPIPPPERGQHEVRPLGFSGNHNNVKTQQIVNCWKASLPFEKLVLSRELGEMVHKMTGWSSVRVIQDQTWLKPPSAMGLGFHRDRGYFMFKKPVVHNEVVMAADVAVDVAEAEYKNGIRVVTLW